LRAIYETVHVRTFRSCLAECGSYWDPTSFYASKRMFYGYICYIGLPFFPYSRPNFEKELFKARRRAVDSILSSGEGETYINFELWVVLQGLQEYIIEKKKKEPFLITSFFKAPRYRIFFRFFFFLWVASFILLGFLGAKPVEYPYSELSVLATGYYFCFFLFFV
jgi:quinol-cytochrome oxidoreductase complex cytochrome b subunit